ncbi:MAG: nitrous oxide reductase family maturation protein NosD [Candidatus Thorarchaeota archaeon]
MKSKTKLIIGLIILVVNFSILMIATYYLTLPEINITAPDDDGEWVVTSPISIDGDGINNWAWAASQGWCNGSGTWNDPYIIENLDIDGTGYDACIRIRDSNAYFLIQNCLLYSARYAGIYLTNVSQGWIQNNTITQSTTYYNSAGIMLEHCDNNWIVGNKLFSNNFGIYFMYCGFHNITENFFSGNIVLGLNISYSFSIIIHGNTIDNTGGAAIWQLRTNFSIFYGNQLSYNDWEGIVIISSYHTQISRNIITYNTYFGLVIHTSCGQNRIFENEFIENGINAVDDGTNNQWELNNVGNYWADYSGFDADDNGIGDTPYNITGSAGSQDNFPIWDDGPG